MTAMKSKSRFVGDADDFTVVESTDKNPNDAMVQNRFIGGANDFEDAPVKKKAATGVAWAGLRHGPVVYSDRAVSVDAKNGVIKNVSLMTIGQAQGWGFDIDATTLDQLVALVQKNPEGVKSRFKHPEIKTVRNANNELTQHVGDDTGTMVGRIKNARIEGNCARGDVHLGTYATMVPGLGNVRDYLLSFADEDPQGIGMSAMFGFHVDPITDQFGNVISRPARLEDLDGIDFVGKPAANPNGLLSAGPDVVAEQPAVDGGDEQPPLNSDDADETMYLKALSHYGVMGTSGFAVHFPHTANRMKATCNRLIAQGCATCNRGRYRITNRGRVRAACQWNRVVGPNLAALFDPSEPRDSHGRWAVYRTGGSIGEHKDYPPGEREAHKGHPVSEHATKEEAVAKADRMNKLLSKGEKEYYGIKYHVKPAGVTSGKVAAPEKPSSTATSTESINDNNGRGWIKSVATKMVNTAKRTGKDAHMLPMKAGGGHMWKVVVKKGASNGSRIEYGPLIPRRTLTPDEANRASVARTSGGITYPTRD